MRVFQERLGKSGLGHRSLPLETPAVAASAPAVAPGGGPACIDSDVF